MNTPDRIRERLSLLAPESLVVEDESSQHVGHAGAGSGGHYRVTLVAGCFAGKPLQARHRMIYDALRPLMNTDIHALAIEAYAPDEI